MHAVTIAALLAVVALGGGIATAHAQLALPDHGEPTVRVFHTLRLDMAAQNAEGPVTYSIEPLEGARIHPVTGHLVYVPVEGQQGLQHITVNATDDERPASITIPVTVDEPTANIDSITRQTNGRYAIVIDSGPDSIRGFAIAYGIDRFLFYRSFNAPANSTDFRGESASIGSEHPLDDTVYFWMIFTGNETVTPLDDRIYARFTPGEDGFEIIPSPPSRPSPVAPDLEDSVLVAVPTVLRPDLVDVDGDVLTITNVTNGENGTAVTDGKTITYTSYAGATGTDTINYTVADNIGDRVTAKATIDIQKIGLPDIGQQNVDAFETLRVDMAARNASGPATYSIEPPVEGAFIHPDSGQLFYVPPASHAGVPQTLTVRAEDDHFNATSSIAVTVGDPIVTVTGFGQSGGSNRIEFTTHGSPVSARYYDILDETATPHGDAAPVAAGQDSSLDRDVGSPEDGRLYYVAFSADADTDWNEDSNVYASFTPGGDDFEIIPNPHTRPEPFAPDIAASASPGVPWTFTPVLLGTDGGALAITQVAGAGHGEVAADATTVTYTPDLNVTGPETLIYTVSDDKNSTGTGTISIAVISDAFSMSYVGDRSMGASETLRRDIVVHNASGSVTYSIDPPVDGARIHPASGHLVYLPPAGHANTMQTITVHAGDGMANISQTIDVTVGDPIATVMESVRHSVDLGGGRFERLTLTRGTANVAVETSHEILTGDTRIRSGSLFYNDAGSFQVLSAHFDSNHPRPDTLYYFEIARAGDERNADANIYAEFIPRKMISKEKIIPNPNTRPDPVAPDLEAPGTVTVPVFFRPDLIGLDGDDIAITSVTNGTKGTAKHNATTITYTSYELVGGPDTITYTVTDDRGVSSTATITINLPGIGLPDDREDNVDALETLRDDIVAHDAMGPVRYSIDPPVDGARIHPASGHLVYLPPAGHANTMQTITIHADDGISIANTSITVTVDDPTVTVTNLVQDGNSSRMDFTLHSREVFVRSDSISDKTLEPHTNTLQWRLYQGSNVSFDTELGIPEPGRLYYVAFITGSNGDTSDNNIYAKFTPGGDTFEIIPNPHTRPDPFVPNITASVSPDTPRTFEPELIDADGGELAITQVTGAVHGDVDFNATTITYTPVPNFTLSETLTYTVADDKNTTVTGTIDIAVTSDTISFQIIDEQPPVRIFETLRLKVNTNNASGDVRYDIDPPLEGAFINPSSGHLVYVPVRNQEGMQNITVRATDDHSTVSTTIPVMVNGRFVAVISTQWFEESRNFLTVVRTGSSPAATVFLSTGESSNIFSSLDHVIPARTDVGRTNSTVIDTSHPVDNTLYLFIVAEGSITGEHTNDRTFAKLTLGRNGHEIIPNPYTRPDHYVADFNTTVEIGQSIILEPELLDNDGNNLTLTLGADGARGEFTTDGATITYTPGGSTGDDTTNYTMTDNKGLAISGTINVRVISNQPPVIEPIDDIVVTTGETISFDVNATDTNTIDGLRYIIRDPLPPGVGNSAEILDRSTGRFHWTPDENQTGTHPINLRVWDGQPMDKGLSHYRFTITVHRSILQLIPDVTIPERELYTFNASLGEGIDIPGHTFGLRGAPRDASIDPATGVFRWIPSERDGGIRYTFLVTVINSTGDRVDQQSLTIAVTETNEDPVFDPTSTEYSINVGERFRLDLNATDQDRPNQTVSYRILAQNASKNPAVINETTGLLTWTPTTADLLTRAPNTQGLRVITVQAVDSSRQPGFANLTISITVNLTLNVFETLRVDASVPGAAGQARYSIDPPVDGARIHPASGHLVYLPPAGHANTMQTITVHAGDGNIPQSIDVAVGDPIAEVSGSEGVDIAYTGGRIDRAVTTRGTAYVPVETSHESLSGDTRTRSGSLFSNAPGSFARDSAHFDTSHPRPYTLYYFEVAREDGERSADANIYAEFTPRKLGFTAAKIIPNPNTRPAPVAPDLEAPGTVTVPVFFRPDLVGLDGGDIVITGVTNGTKGTAISNATTITYTSYEGVVGSDIITYTVTDDRGVSSTATATIKLPGVVLDDIKVDDEVKVYSTLRLDVAVQNATGRVRYDIDPPVEGARIHPNTGHLVYVPPASHAGMLQTLTVRAYDEISDDSANITVTVGDPFVTVTSLMQAGGTATINYTVGNSTAYARFYNLLDDSATDHDSAVSDDAGSESHLQANLGIPDADRLYYVAFSTDADTDWNEDSNVYARFTPGEGSQTYEIIPNPRTRPDPFVPDIAASANSGVPRTVMPGLIDADGGDLVITQVTGAVHGDVDFNATTITYTPVPNFTLSETLTYTVADDKNTTVTGTIDIAVTSDTISFQIIDEQPPVRIFETLRLKVNTNNASGDVRYDIDPPLEGAFIHPVTGHLYYVPVSGQDGMQNITVRATDDRSTVSATIPVRVGQQVATITSIESDSLSATATLDVGPSSVNVIYRVIFDVRAPTLSLQKSVSANSIAATRTLTVANPGFLMEDDAIFAFIVADGSVTSGLRDNNIFAQFEPGTNNWEIIPNPRSRPDHYVANFDTTVQINRSVTIRPVLLDNDGNNLTITVEPDGTRGRFTTDGTTITYTSDGMSTGNDTTTYTMTDNLAHDEDGTINVRVVSNQSPDITPIDDIEASAGQRISFDVDATDPNAIGSLQYAVLDPLPTGVTDSGQILNMDTGRFNWRPDNSQRGFHTIHLRVWNDGLPLDMGASSLNFTITVHGPVLEFIPDMTIPEHGLHTFDASAVEGTDIPGLTFGIAGGPEGSSINPENGTFSWRPSEDQGGRIHNFSVTVMDGGGAMVDSQDVSINVTELNLLPVIDPIDNFVVTVGETVSFNVSATDMDTDGGLRYRVTSQPPGVGESSEILNRSTGRFEWTPDENQTGIHSIHLSVWDGHLGGSSSVNFNITVHGRILAAIPTDILIPEHELYTFNARLVEGADVPGHTFGLRDAPDGAAIVPANGSFSWRPSEDQGSKIYDFMVTVMDSANTTVASQAVKITVYNYNPPPVIEPIDDIVATTGETISFDVNADDIETIGSLRYDLDPPLPPGVGESSEILDRSTGRFEWTPDENQAGIHPINLRVWDGQSGNKGLGHYRFNITVTEPNRDPVFDPVRIEHFIYIGDTFRLHLNATDDNIPAQTVSYRILAQNASENPAVINTTTGLLTWTPTAVESRTITVQARDDQTPPGTADITLTVTAMPASVVAVNDRVTATGLGALVIPVLDNDLPAGRLVIVNVISNLAPEHDELFGTVRKHNDTHVAYEPGPAVTTLGIDGNYTYTVRETGNNTGTANLIITIEPPLATITVDTVSMEPDVIFNITTYAQSVAGRILEGGDAVYNFAEIAAPAAGTAPAPEQVTVTGLAVGAVHTYQFARTDDTSYTGRDIITDSFTPSGIMIMPGSLANQTASEGSELAYPIPLVNPADHAVTWRITSDDLGAIIDGDGTFRWTPGEEHGDNTHRFDFEAAAQGSHTITGTFHVEVAETNQNPVFDDIIVPLAISGERYVLNVTATDADIPEQNLNYSITFQSASNNAAMINDDSGTITWTPDANGTKTITVSVSDDYAPAGTTTLNITITVRDMLPVASATVDTTGPNPVFAITAYSQDPVSGRILDAAGRVIYTFDNIASATNETSSSMRITTEFDPPLEPGNYTYQFARTADADYTGSDVFDGMFVITARVLPPVAPEEFVMATLNMPVTITPAIGSPSGLNVFITAAFGATGGVIDTTSLDRGDIIYTPTVAGNDTITYTVRDTAGGMTNGTITVFTSAPDNSPPELDRIEDMEVLAGEELNFTATANDTDGDPLTFGLINEPAGARINNATGAFSWMPDENQTGDHPVTITVSDGRGGSDSEAFSINVTAAIEVPGDTNRNPMAPDIQINTRSNALTRITPDVTDPDGDDITIISVTGQMRGTVDQNSLVSGTILYRPNQTGIERLTYEAEDGRGGTDSGMITIYINERGNARPALAGIGDTGTSVGTNVNFTANAADSNGDPLTFDIGNAPEGATINATTGYFSWTPAESQNGTHIVTIIVHDGRGGASWQDVTITVLRAGETNRPPVPEDITTTAVIGEPKTFQPRIMDPDGDTVTMTLGSPASRGTILDAFVSRGILIYIGTGLGAEEFTYTLSDGRGGVATGTIRLEVLPPANISPTLGLIGDRNINALRELAFDADAIDIDSTMLTFDLIGAPAGAQITPQGAFSWTPTEAQEGRHSFTVIVSDDAGGNDTETITVNVRDKDFVNSPPLAPDIVDSLEESTPGIIRPPISDPNDDPVRITVTTGNTKGEIITGFLRAGIVIYRPDTGQTGIDTVNYTVSDGSTQTSTGTITIFINADGNRNPVLAPIGLRNINAGEQLAFNILARDSDPISYLLAGAPAGAEISEQGAFSWTPTPADVGNHTFTIAVYDERGGSISEVVTVRVLPAGTANGAPIAPTVTITVGTGSSTPITPEIGDPDGDQVSITGATGDGSGTIIPSPDSILYIAGTTPGTETVTYTVEDARGATAMGTIIITLQ